MCVYVFCISTNYVICTVYVQYTIKIPYSISSLKGWLYPFPSRFGEAAVLRGRLSRLRLSRCSAGRGPSPGAHPWETCGKILGKSWENSWEKYGKTWKIMEQSIGNSRAKMLKSQDVRCMKQHQLATVTDIAG